MSWHLNRNMSRPVTRSQSYMIKWAVTYEKKIQRRNYLIKNLLYTNKDMFGEENLAQLYRNNKEQTFIEIVIHFLENMDNYCLKCDETKIKSIMYRIKSVFYLDHILRRKYKELYEKVMEIKMEEKLLFSKERLEGEKGEEFLKSVRQYLFTNGNNELMNFQIYYKLLEEMKQ